MKRNSLIIFILIFYCLTILIVVGWPEEPPAWLESIFDSSLYIMIGIFILIRGDSLNDYNIDSLSLVLFILFGTIFRSDIVTDTSLSTLFKVGVWGINGLIVIRIVRGKIPLVRPARSNAIWILIGLMSGVFLAIPLAYLITQVGGYHVGSVDTSQYTSLNYIFRTSANAISESAIPQEFMFRGLLLGYLKKLNDDNKAYLIQGLVFWLYHFNLIFWSPLGFWIFIPLGALLLSLLAWRSRSLAPSIAAHAAYNTFYVIFAILMGSK